MDVNDPDGASPELDPPELDPPELASPELDPPELDPPELDPPDDPATDDPSPALDPPSFGWPVAALFAGAAVARRSFLAQPLPLKWITGGANARVTAPSQSGHWWGPASLRPWKTSNRWRHELQT